MTVAAVAAAAVTFSVSPERLALRGHGRAALVVRAPGAGAAEVTAAVTGYRLDLRGRPHLDRARSRWLRVFPQRLLLGRGRSASVDVLAAPPRGAPAGDHAFAVVLTFARRPRSSVPVLARLGVVVVVRVPGVLQRGLRVAAVRVLHRRLRVLVANRGDVDELLAPGDVVVRVFRGRRVVVTLRTRRRRVLAHARALFEWRLPRRVRGTVQVLVGVRGGTRPAAFPLRV